MILSQYSRVCGESLRIGTLTVLTAAYFLSQSQWNGLEVIARDLPEPSRV
jgi:hypothetical protein